MARGGAVVGGSSVPWCTLQCLGSHNPGIQNSRLLDLGNSATAVCTYAQVKGKLIQFAINYS